jgi:hypothetical protein
LYLDESASQTGYSSHAKARGHVAGVQGDRSRKVAACAVAADRDPRRIATELRSPHERPAITRQSVLERAREPVLGREAVLDREDPAAGPHSDSPAETVVRPHVADDPATAVEEHEQSAAAADPTRLAEPRLDPASG